MKGLLLSLIQRSRWLSAHDLDRQKSSTINGISAWESLYYHNSSLFLRQYTNYHEIHLIFILKIRVHKLLLLLHLISRSGGERQESEKQKVERDS